MSTFMFRVDVRVDVNSVDVSVDVDGGEGTRWLSHLVSRLLATGSVQCCKTLSVSQSLLLILPGVERERQRERAQHCSVDWLAGST